MSIDIERLINEYSTLTPKERQAITDAEKQLRAQEKREQQLADEKAHAAYIGKCYRKKVQPRSGMFPQMYRYIKIVSPRGNNGYHMTALCFDEHPHYWFDYQAHRAHFPGDYFYGDFDCTPIWTESIGFFCHNILNKSAAAPTIFDEYEEISIEEYDEAMDAMIKELQCLNFPADHYRYGGVLPTAAQWERKDEDNTKD